MTENQISREVLEAALTVHRRLGPGLLESAYESTLIFELEKRELSCSRQVAIPLTYDSVEIAVGFRADVIVNRLVVLELKSVEALNSLHKKQLLTYLRLSGLRLGLLINFNSVLLKDGFVRVVNGL
ncbi:MAG: GxxExxY protein [Bacteroidetes bacterium]|nr:GxxExxY protein [Bacteroidota bacterium]